MLPLARLFGAGLVMVLQTVELAVLVYALDRFGLGPDPLEPDSWHGRPVSRADHEPRGPRFGFLLFVAGLLALLWINVAVVDAILGLS